MPKRKATHAHVGPARGDRPKRKQATTPAPAEPPVPALGLTDEQLRHLAEEVASRIEPRIGAPSAGNTPSMVNIPTMDNIPANLSDPFEPEPEPRRIWILGSSIIKHAFVHVKNSHIGSNLQLHRHNTSVLWQGMGE
nr:uncharacterized protein LOC117688249 isoform X2 [Crassostrea gigas]